jgi:hypothetical protein
MPRQDTSCIQFIIYNPCHASFVLPSTKAEDQVAGIDFVVIGLAHKPFRNELFRLRIPFFVPRHRPGVNKSALQTTLITKRLGRIADHMFAITTEFAGISKSPYLSSLVDRCATPCTGDQMSSELRSGTTARTQWNRTCPAETE